MLPFRELELYDAFMLDGSECEKVAETKYLVFNRIGEAESLELANPNLMVDLIEEEEEEDEVFYSAYKVFLKDLVHLLNFMGESGHDVVDVKEFKSAIEFLLKVSGEEDE